MKPPSRLHCETHQLIERCPHTDCTEHVPGIPGRPLHTLALCGRVLVDVAEVTGGMSQPSIARFLGITQSRVSQLERKALRKVRLRLIGEAA